MLTSAEKSKLSLIKSMLGMATDDDRLPCVTAGDMKPNTLLDFTGRRWTIESGQGWTRINEAGTVRSRTDVRFSDLVIFYREEDLNSYITSKSQMQETLGVEIGPKIGGITKANLQDAFKVITENLGKNLRTSCEFTNEANICKSHDQETLGTGIDNDFTRSCRQYDFH
jgi:hypothetical protein